MTPVATTMSEAGAQPEGRSPAPAPDAPGAPVREGGEGGAAFWARVVRSYRGAARPPLDRVVTLVAAVVCFFFATTLRDVRLRVLVATMLPAPPVPVEVVRDARVDALVVDEADAPLPGASVRAFAMRPDAGGAIRAYFAGEATTDGAGRARLEALPRGELWLVAYGAGRARASTRIVLDAPARDVRIVLRPAAVLDVLVVDEDDRPLPDADVRVTTGDPLPHVARTTPAGTARFDRLGPSPWTVGATARGFDDVERTGVVAGPAPLKLRLERLGAIVVTVVDGGAAPVSGATVFASGPGLWPARSTTTDDRGQARIAGLHAGAFDLKATQGERASRTEIGVPLARGETRDIRLTLEPGRRVVVHVTDGEKTADGPEPQPVRGAAVVLAEEGLSSFPLEGRTDDKGVVVLGPIGPSAATVSARAQGFVPRSAVAVGEQTTEVTVALSRGGALAGDVVDDRGYPVAGASIEVVGTDTDGMPVDETASLTEFRDAHFEAALTGPRPLIPMGELGVMPGPIPDVPHEGFVVPGATGGGDPWVTRADGTFRAEPLPPGRVQAIVRHPAYVETTSELVTIRAGATAEIHVVLRQGGSLEGRVIEEDRTPVAGARIEVAAMQGSWERATYSVDDGTFALAAVPGEVLVSVSRPETPGDVAVSLVLEVPERDRREIEIVLPKLRDGVAVHVEDDRGYPVSRAEVRAVALDADVPLRRTLFTSDDGDAEVADGVGLPLRLTVSRPGKAPRVVQLDPAPREVRVVLSEGVTAGGTITGRDGRDRIEGADITVYASTGPRHGKSDPEGAFSFADLAPGRVRLLVRRDGYAPAEVVRTVGDDPDRPTDLGAIDLAEAGEVSGIVVDGQDEPVAGARVARDAVPTYLPLGPLPAGIVATDRHGRFALSGLPEGEVDLEAYFADLGRAQLERVRVTAGRTASGLKIVLPGDAGASKEAKGAASVAVTLGEEHGTKSVVIVMVPTGSEAEVAGLEPGDELVTVNGREVHDIEEARRRLTGPMGQDVIVRVRRDIPDASGASTTRATLLFRVRRERVRR